MLPVCLALGPGREEFRLRHVRGVAVVLFVEQASDRSGAPGQGKFGGV
jgi:hypothetical protein